MSELLDALPFPSRRPLRISTDIPRCSSGSSSGSSPPANQSTPASVSTSSADSPQCLFHVLCMHDFDSSDPAHLPFHKDEVLTIVKQEHSGWWAAMRPEGDRMGWIPSPFVLPLDRSRIVDYQDEALWPYGSLNDPPVCAMHDLWVPVSDEDSKAFAFQLATPTDIVFFKDVFDVRAGHESDDSLLDSSLKS